MPTKVSIILHTAPTKNKRKIISYWQFKIILMFQNHANKVRNYRWMLRFVPIPSALEHCCATHCAKGTIGDSDKCQWNFKNIWHDTDSNPDLLLENFLSSPHSRDFFWIKRVSQIRLKKWPYWLNNFSYIFKNMRRKIKGTSIRYLQNPP